jgi:hypothetical protein
MTRKMMTTNLETLTPDFWETNWYKEWKELAKRDYHTHRPCGQWICYYDNSTDKIIYEYVNL